jgi:hypothetical protein
MKALRFPVVMRDRDMRAFVFVVHDAATNRA